LFSLCDVDAITLSGSGEPTLAQNLGEILTIAKEITMKPVGILTNGSLLSDSVVREEVAIADRVAVKVDAISADLFRHINHPVPTVIFQEIWAGLLKFRQIYSGHLAVQTMLLSAWSQQEQEEYVRQMRTLLPDEIQLNTPTRPRPFTHQLESRGNHIAPASSYPTRQPKQVTAEVLQVFGDRIAKVLGIPVRYPLLQHSS
jgi:wyosine [tRNA(Phe)-imidazoG37] synthetase (radical SAM superfamily)